MRQNSKNSQTNRKIRYAVVGLGYIAQIAVLPAFQHARSNSQLVALVSGDPLKLRKLGKKYGVARTYSYEQYDECLESGEVDAVYIALPNSMHCEYTVRAAEAGIQVLCEKPLAVTESECQEMIAATDQNNVKLMTAYRLHFEKSNLEAIEIVRSGKLGEPRIFSSLFTMQVREGDIRLQNDLGGGPLYDIGIYCINAARYLFRSEPLEVCAFSACGRDRRFREVDEMTSGIMRFPDDRLASFTCSFGSTDLGWYQVLGTKGQLRVDHAYDYAEKHELGVAMGGRTQKRVFSLRDQFAPELEYFSKCILTNRTPEPSGEEGLADVRIIRALLKSARTGEAVQLGSSFRRTRRPDIKQEIQRPKVEKPELVHATAPSRE